MQGTISASGFDFIREFVHERSAIVLEPGKEYLVESRLGPIARESDLFTLDDLVARVRDDSTSEVATRVVEAMTTNETSFFRDVTPFDSLRDTILPELIERRAAERKLTIWSGAVSSGQEAYTVAMLIADHFADRLADWDVRILGTDLSRDMVKQAREGLYSQLEVNRGLPAPLLGKHFDRVGRKWQAKENLRKRVEFRQMNLTQPWVDVQDVDIAFLRNVLVFFDRDTKRGIFDGLRRVLRPGGYLLLGAAESPAHFSDDYERAPAGAGGIYRLVPGGA